MGEAEVLAQDAIFRPVAIRAASLLPHVDGAARPRRHLRVEPEVEVLGHDAAAERVGVVLLLGREHIQIGRCGQHLEERGVGVGPQAAAEFEAVAGQVGELKLAIHRVAQPDPELGRNVHAGLDESL